MCAFILGLPFLQLPLIHILKTPLPFIPQYLFEPPWEDACIYQEHWGLSVINITIKVLPHFLSADLEQCNIFQLNYEKHI